MALYVLTVYPNNADYGHPAEVQGVIGPFGTEREASDHAEYIRKQVNPAFKYDVFSLEFPR